MNIELLKKLCSIQATCGDESVIKKFILDYVKKHADSWRSTPVVHEGDHLMDNVILEFGSPKTAIFAHMDSVGFTVRYENQLIPIGGPEARKGFRLVGEDPFGLIECELDKNEDNQLFYKFGRSIFTGTPLTFKPDFREDKDFVQCCYLDNRLGMLNALEVAKTVENGLIIFSTGEEHGGGSVPLIMNYVMKRWPLKFALISDITWVTDGVHHGKGVVISMRDRNIPSQNFVKKIINLAERNSIDFQLEVESGGSSDGREVHHSPYPVKWCFIGAPEDHVHSPDEKVHKKDIASMISLYQLLMAEL